MKVLHTGDTHIDFGVGRELSPSGVPASWESNAGVLRHLVNTALEEGAAAFVHAGDAFRNGRPSQEAWALFLQELVPLARAGVPVILFEGNHERIGVPVTQRTTTATIGAALAAIPGAEVHYIERDPKLVVTSTGVQVAVLPWMSKTAILGAMGKLRVDPVEGDRLLAEYGVDALTVMAESADPSMPLMFASHVTISDLEIGHLMEGGRRGSERDAELQGSLFAEPILPREAIEGAGYAYAALSHIHAPQAVGRVCHYAGSPNRLTFTDADDPKGGNLVTFAGTALGSVKRVKTPYRDVTSIDLSAADADERLARLTPSSLVRLVLLPGDQDPPPEALRAVEDAGARLMDCKRIPVRAERQVRQTLPETIDPQTALRAWLAKDQPDLPEADIDRLVSKAGQILGEAVAA